MTRKKQSGNHRYSGKQKKAALAAKRAAKHAHDAGSGSDADAQQQGSELLMTSLGESNVHSSLFTMLAREPAAIVAARKAAATAPIRLDRHGPPVASAYDTALPIPLPAHWTGEGAKLADVGAATAQAFERWLFHCYAKFGVAHLNAFEHNIEVFRQLWGTIDGCDVVVFLADARNPLFHLNPELIHIVRAGLLCLALAPLANARCLAAPSYRVPCTHARWLRDRVVLSSGHPLLGEARGCGAQQV